MITAQLTWEVAEEPPIRGSSPVLAQGQPYSPEQRGWAWQWGLLGFLDGQIGCLASMHLGQEELGFRVRPGLPEQMLG